MIGQGLSLQQSPPFSSSFRFFILFPVFSILLSISLFLWGDFLFFDRWSFISIGVLHFITIGMISMVMLGALLQMLPVLAGKSAIKAKYTSAITHLLILLGTLNLSLGFINSDKFFLKKALFLLSAGFYFYTFALLFSMRLNKKEDISNNTISAMRASLISLIFNVSFGVVLLVGLLWGLPILERSLVMKIHYVFGLIGWMSILLLGVSFQVIPMFYITGNYKKWFQKIIIHLLFYLVFLEMIVIFVMYYFHLKIEFVSLIIESSIAIVFIGFAFESLRLIKNRKKRFPDVTVQFWQVGLMSLILAVVFFFLSLFEVSFAKYTLKGSFFWLIIFLFGFLISIINGMIYKIVPFLVWFHLFSKGYSNVPNMKQILPEKKAKLQFYIYSLFLLSILIGVLFKIEIVLSYSGGLLVLSTLLFLYNIIKAALVYRRVTK